MNKNKKNRGKKCAPAAFFGRIQDCFRFVFSFVREIIRKAEKAYSELTPEKAEKLRKAGMAAAALVFVFSAVQLLNYAEDYYKQRRTDEELRKVYYGTEPDTTESAEISEDASYEVFGEDQNSAEEVPAVLPDAEEDSADSFFQEDAAEDGSPPDETEDPDRLPDLAAVAYPDNPFKKINQKFTALKKSNRDIIGWLLVPDLVDEAVVQRDNSYYLRRDYLGIHSQEGALFLDENIDLETRPYTLIIYGHNMKSGAKFGFLKRYENKEWAKDHLTMFFNTQYEDGNYVVFAASTVFIGSEENGNDAVNLYSLLSRHREDRRTVIDKLTQLSMFHSPYSAEPDDQLLILVTCVGSENERLVIAARRVRKGEQIQY